MLMLYRIVFSILILVSVHFLLLNPSHAKRLAFVVGINDYKNIPGGRLVKAINDAKAIAAALEHLGYKVTPLYDIGRRQFNRSWIGFLKTIEPGDEVAFFFAGHGIEIDGTNYLVPADVPKFSEGEESFIKDETISFERLMRRLRRERPRRSLIILDACRDNPFRDNRQRAIGGKRGLAIVHPPQGTFVLYSAGAGQTALDRLSNSDRNPNSIFTRHLIPMLQKQGLELRSLVLRLRTKVRQLAQSVHHAQNPAYYDQLVSEKYYIAGAETPPKPLPNPPTPLPPGKCNIANPLVSCLWRNVR